MRFASLCLLSYNRPEFTRSAIESAKLGNFPYELIVHDDGSEDPSYRAWLLDEVDAGHISLLMMNPIGHNEGQGIALNRMFHAAKGDPIVKLDHDLVFKPDWLRKCVSILESNDRQSAEGHAPRIGALGLFHYHHEPVVSSEMLIQRHEHPPWEEHRDFVGSAMVIPRRAWVNFGPFEERSEAFAEDAVFKAQINETMHWCNALPVEDLAENQGFGVGPSTVVPEEGRVAEIKRGPALA